MFDVTSSEKTPCLRSNVAALGFVQISNYLIPLITLPYLTHVLGLESFGKVVFVQLFISYFTLLVDYGFTWTATRKISAHRSDKDYVSRIFFATWSVQWLLLVFSLLLVSLTVTCVERMNQDVYLYVSAFTAVIGTALFPIWFLQGLEKLQAVAALQLLTRVLGLLPIFIFVKNPSDGFWVLLSNGLSAIVGGILALAWIQKKRLLQWKRPGFREIYAELKEGVGLFASRVSISLYTTMVPLILGWLAGPASLACFNLADKVRIAGQSLLSPLSQAMFPRMSILIVNDKKEAYRTFQKVSLSTMCASGILSLLICFFAKHLIEILGGEEYIPAVEALKWLAFCPFLVSVSNLFGVQVLIAAGGRHVISLTSAIVAAIVLVLSGFVVRAGAEYGVAILVVGAEFSIALVYVIYGARVALSWKNQG